MDDHLKPRRSRADEKAEIDDFIAHSESAAEERFKREMQVPPGLLLLAEEEIALGEQRAREREMFGLASFNSP